jgi:hypothetical protein
MKYEQVLMCFGGFRDTSWEADYAKAMSLVAAQTEIDNESALDAETLRYIIYRSTDHDRAQTEIVKGFTQLVAASATHSLSFSVETSCPMRSAISFVNLPTPTRLDNLVIGTDCEWTQLDLGRRVAIASERLRQTRRGRSQRLSARQQHWPSAAPYRKRS